MPLFDHAVALIRNQLEEIEKGNRVKPILIGALTAVQLQTINDERARESQSPITEEVLFLGRHLYQSRVEKDGYTIDDVIDQITSAMDAQSVVVANPQMTAMERRLARSDRYGNLVCDRVVFECTARHPRPELYSVIPKGDTNKPKKQKGHP